MLLYELQCMSNYFTGELSQTLFTFRPVVSNDTASPFRFIKEVPSAPWCVSLQVTWQCCVNNHFHLLQMLLIRSGNTKLACFLITSWSSFNWEWKKWGVSQFVIDSCTIRWCNAWRVHILLVAVRQIHSASDLKARMLALAYLLLCSQSSLGITFIES